MRSNYELLERQARELLSSEDDFVAGAANFAAFIYHELPDVNWAGFYLLTPSGDLLLGPFAGRPACARLPAGRGVCGVAAVRRETQVVDDVDGVCRSHRVRRGVSFGNSRAARCERHDGRRI